jgi:hypothetical protein
MKHNVVKISVTLILAMLTLGLIPIFPAATSPVTKVYVNPASIVYQSPPIAIGYKFNITVWVSDVTDLCAYQVQVRYDEAVVHCYGIWEPTWDANYVLHSIVPLTSVTKSFAPGRATIGGSESPGNPAAHFTGTGLITIFGFQVTNVPNKYETIESALSIDNDQTFLLDGFGANIPIDQKVDGDVQIIWKQPPKPWFASDSAVLNPMPYFTNVLGTEFPINVDIKNYYAGWHMTYADFNLTYNPALITITAVGKVALNLADFPGPNTITLGTGWAAVHVAGFVGVEDSGATVHVATITFKVLYQGSSPPMVTGGFNETALHFTAVTDIWDHLAQINDPSVDGSVRIYALLAIPLPYFEISPKYTTLGPAPSIGQTFDVKVKVKNLYEAWHVVAYQIRIGYDDTLLQAVGATEGPFLTDPLWNLYGTLFASSLHMPPKPYAPQWNVAAGGFLLPNSSTSTWDQPTFPNTFDATDRTLFTITFKAIKQVYPLTLSCILGIYPGSVSSVEYLLDKDGNWVFVDEAKNINGNYTITTSLPGRMIDVYTQYPAPYGGQGLNKPSDMFWPQKQVDLTAYVTYNWWPVQHKPVTFKVYDNQGFLWTTLQDYTDADGYAHASFRIPWPCVDPEQYFGVWKVIAEVDIACQVVQDEVDFHYDYLVANLKCTTDKLYYNHDEDVTVTVTFESHAQQMYDVAVVVTIHDELNVPIATQTIYLTIGKAVYCYPKQYREVFVLHIEKFAFAGVATVYQVPLMLWEGHWISAGPEDTTIIYIQPY